MIDWLRKEWFNLASTCSEDTQIIDDYWDTIKAYYASKNRHYHSLSHIYNMLQQAALIRSSIIDYDAFRFAIWYHDIIYKATKKDNEVKSAEFAQKQLKQINLDEKRLKIVVELIKSTQNHDIVLNDTTDNAFFLDIDLSILGSDWKDYETYVQHIRKEYAIYPDFMYKKGRKKALLHFLKRDHIFFTEPYFNNYENQARYNIEKELKHLLT